MHLHALTTNLPQRRYVNSFCVVLNATGRTRKRSSGYAHGYAQYMAYYMACGEKTAIDLTKALRCPFGIG